MEEGISYTNQVKVVEEWLGRKGANNPCPRCGNNSFIFTNIDESVILHVFCKNCGLKFEHLIALLTADKVEYVPSQTEEAHDG